MTDDQTARLLKALSEPDEAACEACLNQLGDYVVAQLSGQDYTAQFPDVIAHLDSCLDCAAAYVRLYEFELAARADELLRVEHVPEPDLSFLIPDAAGPLSPSALRHRLRLEALSEKLRTAIRHVGEWRSLQLSIEMLPLLRPAPATATIRASSSTERFSDVLLKLDPTELPELGLPMSVTAYRDAQQSEECLVEVTVTLSDRSWPDLAGIAVALTVADERHEQITDAWGVASFDKVPVAHLADLKIEVAV